MKARLNARFAFCNGRARLIKWVSSAPALNKDYLLKGVIIFIVLRNGSTEKLDLAALHRVLWLVFVF